MNSIKKKTVIWNYFIYIQGNQRWGGVEPMGLKEERKGDREREKKKERERENERERKESES